MNVESREPRIEQAARAIGPYLDDLVGSQSAAVAGELEAALAVGAPAERVVELLAARPATAAWLAAFLERDEPPQSAALPERGLEDEDQGE